MKYFSIIAAILVLLLVACAPAHTVQPASAVQKQEAQAGSAPISVPEAGQTKESAAEPSTEVLETTPVPAISKEMKALLEKADQKVQSYAYLELIIPNKQQPDTIFVKGSKIKIKLYEYNPYVLETYFDTVYLDTSAKTIVGRCENNKRCVSPQLDNRKKDWNNLNYDQYLPKTPYEFLKQVPATARIVGHETRDSRLVTKMEYEEGGKLVQMQVDENYGMPVTIRIVTSTGEELNYKFNDIWFNSLADKDVTPPVLSK